MCIGQVAVHAGTGRGCLKCLEWSIKLPDRAVEDTFTCRNKKISCWCMFDTLCKDRILFAAGLPTTSL